ncbi:TetR/AcrR family transcriptional regulator [Prescottella agglutinans]|uniref:AcrR family transcriptional regulator n=1 Tax=Prescottella agglutinans TaxID=1644129 RepID=A0ABT6M6D3_9NOCA|nr:TetR/AcrR family transcriptional regulator [Prescottella agglutinans]MDH6279848.1 AcrR family transcriptional regulator [Prescottella agglutinans]
MENKRSSRAVESTGSTPTRTLIVAAARDVFIDRGFFDTRITDITEAAGVASGSFYTYFDSKELVFEAMLDELDAAIMPAPWSPVDGVREWVRANARHYLEQFASHASFWRRVEQAALGNRSISRMLAARREVYVAQVRATICAWVDAGLVAPGVSADVTALALVATTEQCAFQWFVLEDGMPAIDSAVNQLTDLWCRVLRSSRTEGATQ